MDQISTRNIVQTADAPDDCPAPSSFEPGYGEFFEDLTLGTQIDLGSHRFSRDEIVEFACRYDPQPFHLDDKAAALSDFGELVASGWHTAAIWMKLYVHHRERIRQRLLACGALAAVPGPSPGFRNMRWRRPVFVDDTIHYVSTLVDKRLSKRRGWGLVFHRNVGTNQNGRVVIEFEGSVFWQRRPAEG